ncbi:ParA family protein [Desulfogranum japonicum]|uniref:ParA family protein n=1 Tax=Desulfogranum japonicum TaxID=231447 RepID=UPI000417EF99|nr:AAA family ATPase [Desulfogranum japonicum]
MCAKIVALANQKGGVGKTTTALNLSAALAVNKKKILLVDSDPQGNASSGVGCVAEGNDGTIYNCYIGTQEAKDCIHPTNLENLYILPASIDLVGVEIELINHENREKRLKSILRQVRDDFDFIFIDCPPSLGLLTLNSLTAADSVLIPLQCEYFALEGLAQLINTIRRVKKGLNRELYIEGLLLTMYDRRNKLTYSVAKEIRKHFKDQVYTNFIPRNVRLSESPSHGQTIIEYDNSCNGAKAYIKLSTEFLDRIN